MMSKKPSSILFVRNQAYCLGTATSIGDPHETLEAALRDLPNQQPITLAMPSYGCLCAPINLRNLPRARRPAMLYRLEEQFPISMEEIVADFIESDEEALGVAGQLCQLQPIVSAVEKMGLTIACIAPSALLAAQRYLDREKIPLGDVLLFTCDGQLEVFELHDGRVKAWTTVPLDADDVARELQWLSLHHKIRAICCGVDQTILDRIGTLGEVEVTIAATLPADKSAAAMAHAIVVEGAVPLIELWRDPLGSTGLFRGARRHAYAAIASAVLLLITLFGAAIYRTNTYQRLATDYARRQEEIFTSTFPGKSLNDELSVATQLLREEHRLRGIASPGGAAVPRQVSSLRVLQQFLTSLPSDGRCDVSDLRIEDDQVSIEAVVPTHADAAAIANSLSEKHAFIAEPPRTEQLAGDTGVAMSLRATLAQKEGGRQ